jgi:hypothetical protein
MSTEQIQQPDYNQALKFGGPDPLSVLNSTAAVMASAHDASIDMALVHAVADQLAGQEAAAEWDTTLHYRATGPDADERTAMWLLVLDALNFCFWGQGPDPSVRWRVEWHGEIVDGYMALTAALRRGVEEGQELHSASWLAGVEGEDVRRLLRPAEGHPEIPLFETRVHNLRELGRGLLALDSETPATALITSVNGSAVSLVREVVRRFPSFNDIAIWTRADTGLPGHEVRFYKQAQILVGDLAGGLDHSSLGQFHDLDTLTAFADYKVPQVLRQLGILCYSDSLAGRIARREHLSPGCTEEIEIRAGTIWGCELVCQALDDMGRAVSAHELDWLLWTMGQSLPKESEPYHLTPTIFY